MNIGDVVYFRDDLVVGKYYGSFKWINAMSEYKSGVVNHYDSDDDTFMLLDSGYWYSTEMVEKVVSRVSLIENQRELKRLEEELKLHRSQFNEEIAELTKVRDELKAENEQLRLQALEMDESELEDGVSISWQNTFQMNLAELDDEYILLVPDEKRIRSELVASEWTKPIKGVVVTKVPRLRVSVN